MKFKDLDSKMRAFEQALDQQVPPEVYIVARIDGRSFTRLTKEELDLERPFDVRFRDAMIAAASHLMRCGIRPLYGYTQSDEISLLLRKDDSTFERNIRKLTSVLAGEASAAFSLAMGAHGAFDCRLSPLPSKDLVIDYFRWRGQDAHRNSLSAWCYWSLRDEGATARQADREIQRLNNSEKNEFLFQRGINYNDLPAWQKRGIGLRFAVVERDAVNPITNEAVKAQRKELQVDMELPFQQQYSEYLNALLAAHE